MKDIIRQQLKEAKQSLEHFMADESVLGHVEQAASVMIESLRHGGKIITCGNGGSMCDAMHFAEELCGRFRNDRRPLPAVAISDPSFLTCTGNDYGFDFIFSRYVEALGNKGDVLLAVSTSGNSKNVIQAAHAAQNKGMKIVALTGKDGGQLKLLCDVEIRAPHSDYADRAQEIHIKVIHCLIMLIEKSMA
jgi:D-sedoheptulose 7-phosphate isomerase